MGLFGKKRKPRESNEINNSELKIKLADTALGLLAEGEEFGYLFDIERHGIEALFKLVTDKTTAYFAAQGDRLMRLDFNEELFQTTVEGFLDMHN